MLVNDLHFCGEWLPGGWVCDVQTLLFRHMYNMTLNLVVRITGGLVRFRAGVQEHLESFFGEFCTCP